MNKEDFSKLVNSLSDEDLIREIFALGPPPNAGGPEDQLMLSAMNRSMEMQRRLKDAIEKADKNTSRYSKILSALTIILIVVAYVQLVISIAVSGIEDGLKIFLEIATIIIVMYTVVRVSKDLILNKSRKN